MPVLTVTGNEITDARRAEGIGVPVVGHSYDGLSGDSSFGIWEATTNLLTNGNASTNTTGWTNYGISNTFSRNTTDGVFGGTCFEIIRDGNAGFLGMGIPLGSAISVNPGETWILSSWMKPVSSSGIAVADCAMNIEEYDSSNNLLRRTAIGGSSLVFDQFKKLQLSIIIGSRAAKVTCNIYTTVTGVGKTLRVGGIQLEKRRAATNAVVSGNEINDTTRLAALSWGTAQLGGHTDQYGWSIANYVRNPRLQSNIANWSIFGGSGTTGSTPSWNAGVAQLSLTGGSTASYGAFVAGSTGSLLGLQQTAMPVTPGQILRARATAMLTALSSGSGVIDVRLAATFYDNAGNVLSTLNIQTFTNITISAQYTLSGIVTVPASAAYALLRVGFGENQAIPNGATFTGTVDNAMLCDNANDPGAYVDGSSVGSTSGSYSWWGTTDSAFTRKFVGDSSYFVGISVSNLHPRGQVDAIPSQNWNLVTVSDTGTNINIDTTVSGAYTPQSARVQCMGIVANGIVARTNTGLALAAGTPVGASIWFKGNAGKSYSAKVRVTNTDATTDNGTALVFTATGDMQLITPAMYAVQTGKTGDSIRIDVSQSVAAAEYIWAANPMIQSGASITAIAPYVATSGGTATGIGADSVTVPASLLSTTQSWMAFRVRLGFDSATGVPTSFGELGDGTSANRISIVWNLSSGGWATRRIVGNVSGLGASIADTFTSGALRTIIIRWTSTTVSVSVNGSVFSDVANGQSGFTPTNIWLGASAINGNSQSQILWAMGGIGTLTNTDAATLNALGNTDPNVDTTLGSTATTSFVWTADGAAYLTSGATQQFATPYIHTDGAFQTRAASRVQLPTNALNPTQGWAVLCLEMGFLASLADNVFKFGLVFKNGSDQLSIQIRPTSPRWKVESAIGGSNNQTTQVGPGWTNINDIVIAIMTWVPNGAGYTIGISINGANFTTTTTSTRLTGITSIDIGSNAGGQIVDSNLKWIMYGTGILTNADAITLNAQGAADPSFSLLPNTAQVTGIIPFDTIQYQQRTYQNFTLNETISVTPTKRLATTKNVTLTVGLIRNRLMKFSGNRFNANVQLFPAGPDYTKKIILTKNLIVPIIETDYSLLRKKIFNLAVNLVTGSQTKKVEPTILSVDDSSRDTESARSE